VDIAHLRDFIAVVDAGSLTQAATQLRVSQPALSQRMTLLEHDLAVRLLERGPRGVVPTRAGRALYRDAEVLVRQFDRLASTVASHQHQVTGVVAVGLPSTVAVHLAPALYSWVKREYPGVHLQLFESMSGYIQELLSRGRMDLAVLYRDDWAPRPGETPLYAESLFLVGSPGPDFAPEATTVTLRQLEGVPLVTPGPRSNLRALIERTFTAHGMAPTIVADVESLGAMLRIAESGEACSILPVSVVEERFGGSGIGVRRIVDPVMDRHVAVCTAGEFFEPRDAVAAVLHGIVEVTRDLARRRVWAGIRLPDRSLDSETPLPPGPA
jgi:LysR family transcriptional regulator, nitrogen assimilation regulatory protein